MIVSPMYLQVLTNHLKDKVIKYFVVIYRYGNFAKTLLQKL